MLIECFFDLCDVVGDYGGFSEVLNVVLHFLFVVGDEECVLASSFLDGLLGDAFVYFVVDFFGDIFACVAVAAAHSFDYRI
jgi:hypothetical protein